MMKRNLLAVLCAVLAASASAVQHRDGWRHQDGEPMTFRADRVAVDNVTKAAVATGHICGVAGPVTLRGEHLKRDAEGNFFFYDPTCVTTCSNDVGHTHWNVTGEVEWRGNESVILRNAVLRFYEVPVFYLPYLYYPLDTDCGFSWMPGYTGRWGAYLLTRYRYDLAGDVQHRDNTWWLRGATRLDLRYRQGLAFGEDFDWNLGDFGAGNVRFYFAWDQHVKDNPVTTDPSLANWGSDVDENRFGVTFTHNWEATERDTIRLRASHYSDSYFRNDFMRRTLFEQKSQWLHYPNSGVIWEHLENAWSFGVEASGRLNDFYAMTERLPEIYFDLNPTPVASLPINYETENRVGWLDRRYAKYARSGESVWGSNPALWCDYEAFRFDTYHRFTAPFRFLDDVVSVVPRLAYRGTFWSETGASDYYGTSSPRELGSMFRSIAEGGVTFAGRGTGWVDDTWSHMIEPYFDVLVQKAYYGGRENGARPYVFDNLDASLGWEDQFAGRSRNLPYSYFGVTPGLRNVWSALTESGSLRPVVDFDVYAAVSFGESSFEGDRSYGDYDAHRLAAVGRPNYGKHAAAMAPGARIRWTPAEDINFMARAEYDSDNAKMALADLMFQHVVTDDFRYDLTYCLRDARYWDFSSTPYDSTAMTEDALNDIEIHVLRVGCEYQPIDWLAIGPYVRWDLDEGELDSVGGWIDYMTDCLGFRFLVEYESAFTRIDGYEHEEDWTFGFYIYLRAFGPSSGDLFSGK